MEILFEGLIYTFVLFTIWALYQWVQVWRTTRGVDDLGDVQGDLRTLQNLAEEKARLLHDIKELDFDHQVGHLSETDHTALRKRLERRAIRVMKKLDALRGEINYDERIDSGLKERFNIYFDDDVSHGEGVESTLEAPTPSENATDACSSCGWLMESDALFCSQCGASLQHDTTHADDETVATSALSPAT